MSELEAARTPRLDLRPVQESDVDGLAAVFAEPLVWHFPYGDGFDRSETERFIEAQRREWATLGRHELTSM